MNSTLFIYLMVTRIKLMYINQSSLFYLQTLINMAYCCLILLGKSIQKVVFGELRISEQQVWRNFIRS